MTAARASHPRGLYVLCGVEMWERFSFHTMRAMLVLFLTAPVASSGFGWASGDALRLYGLYTGLIYLTPVLGGLLADRVFGMQRAIIIGASLMCLGHFLMAGPAIAPWLGDRVSDGIISQVIEQSAVPLGQSLTPEISDRIANAISEQAAIDQNSTSLQHLTERVYLSITASFFAALLALVAGAGLFLPAASSLLGSLYDRSDANRESGFFIFYLAINVGATLAPIAGGIFGERIGWHVGFTVAGFAMLLGLASFLVFRGRYIGDIGATTKADTTQAARITSARVSATVIRDRVIAMLSLSSFLILSELCLGQGGGLLSLFVRDRVDRTVFDYEIPAVWFQSLFPLFIVISLIALTALTPILDRRGRNPVTTLKFAIGFLALALSFLVLLVASTGAELVAPLWVVLVYALMAVTEVLLYPVARAMVTRYAQKEHLVTFMGILFLCIALGSMASGWVGALAEAFTVEQIFATLVVVALVAATVLVLLTGRLRRLSHGLEQGYSPLHSPSESDSSTGRQASAGERVLSQEP
ncbi:MAG: peptide MFS transporter [Pseudomonadota bacterium]